MNAKQQTTVDLLIRKITANCAATGLTDTKQVTISEQGKLVFLVIEHGLPNDSGTAAYMIRDYRHIMVGVAGGCRLLNSTKPETQSKGVWHCVHNIPK